LSNTRFYAVYSRKAVGVVDNWERIEQAREQQHIRLSCKGFDSFDLAASYAIKKYNHRAKLNYSGPILLNRIELRTNI